MIFGVWSQKWLLDINFPNELLVFYLTGLGRSHVVRTVGVIENVTMMVSVPVLR
jgi:propanediol dehydratase large subunit